MFTDTTLQNRSLNDEDENLTLIYIVDIVLMELLVKSAMKKVVAFACPVSVK